MNINNLLAAAVLTTVIAGAACQQSADNNVATNNTNTNVGANANANPPNTAAAPATTGAVSADSPSAAYQAAYTARKNKDIPMLKALISKDILEFFEEVGKEDNKSVDEVLMELTNRPQADIAQVRNEKINGDKATIEYLDENGKWSTMDFIKEDGVWKLTLEMGDPEAQAPEKPKK